MEELDRWDSPSSVGGRGLGGITTPSTVISRSSTGGVWTAPPVSLGIGVIAGKGTAFLTPAVLDRLSGGGTSWIEADRPAGEVEAVSNTASGSEGEGGEGRRYFAITSRWARAWAWTAGEVDRYRLERRSNGRGVISPSQ